MLICLEPESQSTLSTQAPVNLCPKMSFIPKKPDFDVSLNFSQKAVSGFIEECAQLCHLTNCSTAMFLPSQNSLSPNKGTCHFSFDSLDCSSLTDSRTSNFSQFSPIVPLLLQCIRCDSTNGQVSIGNQFLPVIENAPNVLSKNSTVIFKVTSTLSTSSPLAETSTSSHISTSAVSSPALQLTSEVGTTSENRNDTSTTAALKSSEQPQLANSTDNGLQSLLKANNGICSGTITYQARAPNPDRTYTHSATLNSTDVEECIKLCHEKTCTVASYVKGTVPGEPDTCLLGFDEEVCDVPGQRISNYTGRFPVELHCIRCGK